MITARTASLASITRRSPSRSAMAPPGSMSAARGNAATDVTSQLGAAKGWVFYDRTTQLFSGSLTLTNVSGSSVAGSSRERTPAPTSWRIW